MLFVTKEIMLPPTWCVSCLKSQLHDVDVVIPDSHQMKHKILESLPENQI